jgi:hypothetical protein
MHPAPHPITPFTPLPHRNIFFPPTTAAAPPLSPSELGRQRLSMILVADRCGLSPSSLVEMKRDTVRALQDVMDLEELQVGGGG